MAFSKGTVSSEAFEVKRYLGIGTVNVLAVNPDKKKLEEIYNTTIETIPEYISKDSDGVNQCRIDFILRTVGDVDLITKASFFLKKKKRVNKNGDKVQVIDKYGRTAWVTLEQAEKHEIPQYANGPANLDADYRPCCVGEEALSAFIKTYLNIPNVQAYINGAWVANPRVKPEECEARLEKISDYFNGNFKELQDVLSYQPDNKIKVMFGIKTTDDNKQYQVVYTDMVLSNATRNYTRLEKDLTERKAAGAYANVEFSLCDLKEYNINATSFDVSNDVVEDADLPW